MTLIGNRIHWKRLFGYVSGLLLLGAGVAVVPVLRSRAREEARQEFRELLDDLASDDMGVVSDAVNTLGDREEFLRDSNLVVELANLFAARSFPPTRDSLDANLTFWNMLLGSGIPGVEELVTEPLARLRHQGLLLLSTRGSLELFHTPERATHATKMKDFLADSLAKNFFLPPVPEKRFNGLILWDRANLEEIGGRLPAAIDTLELLDFQKVAMHWEFEGRRDRYLLLVTDLVGRLRKKLQGAPPSGGVQREALLARLERWWGTFMDTVPERFYLLVRGIGAFHDGEVDRAISALDLFLAELSTDVSVASRVVKPIYWQMGNYYRALAHFQAAREIARRDTRDIVARGPLTLQQTRLEMRLAQYFAELKFEREYKDILRSYFSNSRVERPLLDALGDVVWGVKEEDREDGRERLRFILRTRPDMIHADDIPWWQSVARTGEVAETLTPVRLLYRAGLIFESKGDTRRLEAAIERMQNLIEAQSQQSYLHLLQALLDIRAQRILEAETTLRRLLAQPELPDDIQLPLVESLMADVERERESKDRIRKHLLGAERLLYDLYINRESVHPDLRLASSSTLVALQFEAPLLYSDLDWQISLGQKEILDEVLSTFARSRHVSYFTERMWLDLRDSAIRYFYEYYKRGLFEVALKHLDLVGRIQHDTEGRQFLELKAMVYHRWAEDLKDRVESVEDQRLVEEYWGRAAAFYEESENPDLRREAVLAYENAGNPFGILRMVDSGIPRTKDRDVLLALGKAQVQAGDYNGGIHTLERLIRLLWVADLPAGGAFSPIGLAGPHFVRDVPEPVKPWLEVDEFVDSINGTGNGYIAFDAQRRALSWQAPGDSGPGTWEVIQEGDRVSLPSSDFRKRITVTVKRGEEESAIPKRDGRWPLRLYRRDFPLEPADAYLWHSYGQIQLARLPIFRRDSDALDFIHLQLSLEGDPEIQAAIRRLLGHIVTQEYADGTRREEIRRRLELRLEARAKSLAIEKTSLRPGRNKELEVIVRRLEEIERLRGRLDTLGGVLELIEHEDQQLQGSLRSAHVELVRRWIEDGGEASLRIIERLERHRLDTEARDMLLVLAENYGYRSPVWQGSMFLRGYQLYRQSLEAQRDNSLPGAEIVAIDSRSPAELQREAREVLTRLARAPGSLSMLRWTPRGMFLLGKLLDQAGEWDRAHEVFDGLTRLQIRERSLDLTSRERLEIQQLVQAAFMLRADASFKSAKGAEIEPLRLQKYRTALHEYNEAAEVFADSSRVLWAQYQIGSCYLKLGRQLEGLRELQKGRSLISRFFSVSGSGDRHWLTGERVDPLALQLLNAVRRTTVIPGGGDPVANETPPDRRGEQLFWVRLFENKIESLSGEVLRTASPLGS